MSVSPISVGFFDNSSAIPTFYPEKSAGKKTKRIVFEDFNYATHYVAVNSFKIFKDKPKIRFWERVVVLNVKDVETNSTGYVKVNEASLRKRFGISKKEFKDAKKHESDLTAFISKKIQEAKAESLSAGYQGERNEWGERHGIGRDIAESSFGSLQPKLSIYDGHFRNDEFHGKGILQKIFWSGREEIFEGVFKNGEYSHGTLTYPKAAGNEIKQYTGQFKGEQFHGKGTVTYYNGDQYIGELKKSKSHGKGEYITKNGSMKGVFKKGRLVEGLKIYADGSKEKGVFKKGHLVEGLKIYSDGSREKGSFKNGRLVATYINPSKRGW
ncbi:putative uncharacterized protein [Parachlamydia acanthamoebae UV-7]|uniref:MORN repeat protein n=2 Tax=Parachlamydia acanthamoebae TaxID=83552 RepID=F8L1U9_PARAV|nr:hypothetical protein [Parachlamydia acanthamoebae]CCB87263.1 putative uncharacterized protein [Parachlamydia acanthamoebae UV-7]